MILWLCWVTEYKEGMPGAAETKLGSEYFEAFKDIILSGKLRKTLTIPTKSSTWLYLGMVGRPYRVKTFLGCLSIVWVLAAQWIWVPVVCIWLWKKKSMGENTFSDELVHSLCMLLYMHIFCLRECCSETFPMRMMKSAGGCVAIGYQRGYWEE